MTTPTTTAKLAGLALAMLLAAVGTSAASIALPALVRGFGASFAQAQWVVVAYLIVVTLLVVPAGRIGDAHGRRRVLLAGVAMYAVAAAWCAMAPDVWSLIAARCVQGAGAAAMMSMSVALAADVAQSGRTGRAMGILGAASAVGTALGPAVGGILIAGYGWRAIFAVMAPLTVVVLLLITLTVPSSTMQGVKARSDGGAAALWREAAVRRAGVTSVIIAAVMMTTLVVGPFYLGASLGLGDAMVGLILSVGPVVAAFSGMPAGSVVDRVGAVAALRLGLAGMIVGCSALAALAPPLGAVGFALSIAVLTASYAVAQAANNTHLMTSVIEQQRGAAAGLLNASRNLGLVAGASGFGSLYAYVAGDVTDTSFAAGSLALRVTLLLCVGLLAAAFIGARRSGPSSDL